MAKVGLGDVRASQVPDDVLLLQQVWRDYIPAQLLYCLAQRLDTPFVSLPTKWPFRAQKIWEHPMPSLQ